MSEPTKIEDDAPLREAVARFLRVVDDHRRYLTSNPGLLPRHLAAAGLWRCRALLEAMATLHVSERRDVGGVLLRSLVEVWLLSLYLLFRAVGKEEGAVMTALAADHARLARLTAEKMGASPAFLAMVDQERSEVEQRRVSLGTHAPKSLPNYEEIAAQLDALTADAVGGSAKASHVYRVLYRGESFSNAHANLQLLIQHVDVTDDNDRLIVLASIDGVGPRRIAVERLRAAGILTGYLALNVFKAFGVNVQPPLEEVLATLGDVAAAVEQSEE